MFDLFSGPHILILLVVALLVVGPKDLPRLMNMVGQWAGKARRMANEFKQSFDEMARQEELDKLRKELDELRQTNVAVADMAQEAARIDLPPESGPEPRSGEFQVTASAPAPQPASEPAPESAGKTP